jgi:type II secretory pathway pseudopilin PulG
MITVVIVGILSAVAIPAYSRYRYRGWAVEATEVLAQIAHAQEGYRAEYSHYADVSHDQDLSGSGEGTAGGLPGVWWPTLGAATSSSSGRVNFYTYGPGLPAAWNQLGVRPRQMVRYSFQTIAGNPGVVPAVGSPGGSLGYTSLPDIQRGPWYYATAAGDLDGDGIYGRYEITSLRPGVNIIGQAYE